MSVNRNALYKTFVLDDEQLNKLLNDIVDQLNETKEEVRRLTLNQRKDVAAYNGGYIYDENGNPVVTE